ncbi:General stress protein 69 [Maioricimonas rarisocia]|uniref:General stress protein 69 n=1 Tax=Maioricimonas rarisocia TaxID=2528026 RepID=A0A517ZAH5_9PLAN|nr:aldo/keto reductase [Maioricimonas rarisocia]QDU39429.1 General stress protein 69 [Maioricimonas rarisocia]
MTKRQLGQSDLWVSPVAMGCWPIAGITSINVTEKESQATLEAAVDAGINFFDTAYSYGYDGESERLIGRALGHRRDEVVIATKCGQRWGPDRQRVRDGSPERIHQDCDESLRRLGTDRIDLYYLHAPDPDVPIEDSAGALRELLEAGKIRAVGVSNFHRIEQYEAFHAVCPITANQPHYNMLQREIEEDRLPWCRDHDVSVCVYWPLMKGFLAGKLSRDHQWDPKDGRQKYPIFQGEEWTKTHDFLDRLRPIAARAGHTLAQLAVAWVIQRPGITAALCGAKRPDQIRETAAAMDWQLSPHDLAEIDAAIAERGPIPSQPAL